MRTRPCALARGRLLNTSPILGSMVEDSLTLLFTFNIYIKYLSFSLSFLVRIFRIEA
jgi:hypothetical protein